MTENVFTPHTEPQAEPALRRNLELPKGVLQKNLKTFVYLGAASLVIVAALFSSSGKKTPAQQAAAKGQPPQPTLQDNTDSNVQELKNQLQAERQKEQQAAVAAAALGEIIRRRTICSNSTQQNGGIGLDPAESQAVVKEADQPLLFLFLREGAIGPSVTKAFQVGSRDLSNVYESVGRGPCKELLLEDRSQLIESRVG
jgi:hypothetical protein